MVGDIALLEPGEIIPVDLIGFVQDRQREGTGVHSNIDYRCHYRRSRRSGRCVPHVYVGWSYGVILTISLARGLPRWLLLLPLNEYLPIRGFGSRKTIANASVVCTDKTGTLTQNVMTAVADSIGIHAKSAKNLEGRSNVGHVGDEADTKQRHKDDFSIDPKDINDSVSRPLRGPSNDAIAYNIHLCDCFVSSAFGRLAIATNSTPFEGKDPDTGKLISAGSKTEMALLQLAKDRFAMSALASANVV